MANCKLCHNPIVLIPSAQERAAKHGGAARDYTNLFDMHPGCSIEQRTKADVALMRKIAAQLNGSVLLRWDLTHREAYGW